MPSEYYNISLELGKTFQKIILKTGPVMILKTITIKLDF